MSKLNSVRKQESLVSCQLNVGRSCPMAKLEAQFKKESVESYLSSSLRIVSEDLDDSELAIESNRGAGELHKSVINHRENPLLSQKGNLSPSECLSISDVSP